MTPGQVLRHGIFTRVFSRQPGVSSLMAKQLIRKILEIDRSLAAEDLTVDFNFFTAGSSRIEFSQVCLNLIGS